MPAGYHRAGGGQGCPYHFQSEMPAGQFCVYRGTVRSASGAVCRADAVVIWSVRPSATRDDGTAEPAHDVYFGLADQPTLVIHGVATRQRRARLTDYSVAPGAPQPLGGLALLVDSSTARDVLSLAFQPALGADQDCAADVYRGRFLGVARWPDLQTGAGGPAVGPAGGEEWPPARDRPP